MHIIISGGTGLIGKKLTDFFLSEGHHVTILTRSPIKSNDRIQYVRWLAPDTKPEMEIHGADVWINLAGTSINKGRWSKHQRRQIYESRVTATDEVFRIISTLPENPFVLINASAIGIYPASRHAIYTEKSPEIANDFLGKTVADWEKRARQIESLGIRTVLCASVSYWIGKQVHCLSWFSPIEYSPEVQLVEVNSGFLGSILMMSYEQSILRSSLQSCKVRSM